MSELLALKQHRLREEEESDTHRPPSSAVRQRPKIEERRCSHQQLQDYVTSEAERCTRHLLLPILLRMRSLWIISYLMREMWSSPRLFPLNETSLYRSEAQREDNVLGSCRRCFRGHNGAVTALSDELLGNGSAKLLASGGEDGTVRLWSFSSGGKRGQHALKATFHGHEKPIKLMSVAGHKTSHLVTVTGDSKRSEYLIILSTLLFVHCRQYTSFLWEFGKCGNYRRS